MVMAELTEKRRTGDPDFFCLCPGFRDVRSVRGTLQEVFRKRRRNRPATIFVKITLTDDREPAYFREQLRERYDHILEIRIDNERTREEPEGGGGAYAGINCPMEVFRRFFTVVQKSEMTKEEEALMEQIIEEAKEEMK